MKKHRWTAAVVLTAGAWYAAGQTAVDLTRQGKLGTGTILPATCAVGQMFFKTDAPNGANLYACANSGWVTMGVPALSAAGPPATCAAGSFYLRSDTANNIQQLYVCSNTNTWTMASGRSGLAANRPVNCVAGQTWLSTDTAAMTYCSATGNPGTWSATLAGPPDWRSDVKAFGPLPDQERRKQWWEQDGHGHKVRFELVEDRPPARRAVRIADPNLPFGGTWTFEISPAPGGADLSITEDGEVRNVFFRFLSRFLIGHTSSIDRFFRDLSARTAERAGTRV